MNNFESIYRNNDLVYGNNDLEFLYTHKKFPVFMGCVDSPESDDDFFDMNWYISKQSGMIQLNPIVPAEVIYQKSHYSGTTGNSWEEHHTEFANFILKFNPEKVLEIGGLHGTLAKKCKSKQDINWTIIDPNVQSSLKEDGINTINSIFDENFKLNETYKTIVHSHLLEHVFDINKFLTHIINAFNNKSGKMFFSIPNMRVMLEKNFTNCLNFEHTFYLSDEFVEFFLEKYNFKILNKTYFKEDHSIFYHTEYNPEYSTNLNSINYYEKNKKLMNDYIKYQLDMVNRLNEKIEEHNGNIYIFGAHVFSQYLVVYGLNTKKIKCLLDNNVNKHDKRLYGTTLLVQSPKILKNDTNPLVILRAGVFNNEIKKDILENINKNAIIIE